MEKRGMHVHPETSPTKWASTHRLGFPVLTTNTSALQQGTTLACLRSRSLIRRALTETLFDALMLIQQW
jgi:hypothetical protein